MKIALVHDYLKEYGGAERVLQVLHEMFPEAPIYTAFLTPGSTAAKAFSGAKIITSWANLLIRYKNLYSPLRFLTPLIWESFDFSKFDVVILSSSWFITKPIHISKRVKVICYCHTPPRYLYGYRTAIDWQKYWPVKVYGHLLGHFLRLYDFLGAKRVNQFVANSKNVAERIKKFYRKSSIVIYPPVEIEKIKTLLQQSVQEALLHKASGKDYFLVTGRISSEKGLPMAMEAANKLGAKLKIVGEFAGLRWEEEKINKNRSKNIEFLGRVTDEELYKLYAGAKAFLGLEQDVDFGMTPVEAMAAGCPVVAYKSGGYLETVTDKTGVFFEKYNVESLINVIKKFKSLKFKKEDLREQAEKFSKEIFVKKMKEIVHAGIA